jgi:hypothetical protein
MLSMSLPSYAIVAIWMSLSAGGTSPRATQLRMIWCAALHKIDTLFHTVRHNGDLILAEEHLAKFSPDIQHAALRCNEGFAVQMHRSSAGGHVPVQTEK